jgi:glycosyltransferase involved in cell wall biosynthesis
MRDTVIVIPCYNEAGRLDVREFTDYPARDQRTYFLFVNDGSTDGTRGVLDGLNRQDPCVFRVLHLRRNAGKAEAVRQGALLALQSAPSYVGYWDADLATPLGVIGEFRALLETRSPLELVLGSRVRLLGREVHRSRRRHYLGRVFATMASTVLGLSVYDTQCGAKLFRATPATHRLFQEPFRSSWIFDVEILARMVRDRYLSSGPGAERVVCELPLPCWRDVDGSKVKARDFLRAPFELAVIYRHYLAGLRAAGPAPTPYRPHLDMNRVTPRPHKETVDRLS